MAIEILKSQVVDQISAGEVVERPAHLIKELVENSFDAGATEVEVEFDSGGRQASVRDNGCGMNPEDLALSLARHSTSKIRVADDLWALSTFGFRGEALASISAVSDLTLISRPENTDLAHELKSSFGQVGNPIPSGGDRGTSVYVRELFGNTPARRKFLKSDLAEANQIKQVLKAMALSSPKMTLRVRSKNQLIYFWPASESRRLRVEQVLDTKPLYETEGSENGILVNAVFSAPHQVVKNSRQIWLFVRGRWVLDRGLMAAVMESYRHLLMHGEFPVVALWIDIPPSEVDVNIHPTKSQVKFRDSSQVFRTVVHVLRSALEKSPWLKEILKDSAVRKSFAPRSSQSSRSPLLSVSSSSLEKEAIVSRQTLSPREDGHFAFSDQELNRTQYPQKSVAGVASLDTSYQIRESEITESMHAPASEKDLANRWSDLQIIGQAHLTYIVAQSDRSLILIDQHAAHERVAFESLMKNWGSGPKEVQKFLLPHTVSLPADHLEAILSCASELEKVGIAVEQLGPENAISVGRSNSHGQCRISRQQFFK